MNVNITQLIEREIDTIAVGDNRVIRAVEIYRLIRDAYAGADFATTAQLDRLSARLYAEGFGVNLKETA